MTRLVDLALTTFPIIRESATPKAALAALGPPGLACVVDHEGSATALVMRRDLESAQERRAGSLADPPARLPVSVVAEKTVEIEDLFSQNVFPAFAAGARGAILVSADRRPVGVLHLDVLLRLLTDRKASTPTTRSLFKAFTDYLLLREPSLKTERPSGILPLYGRPRPVEILIHCPQCGRLNRLKFLDPGVMPRCQAPEPPRHQLTLP
jgi:hypothetical protein